MAEAKQNAGMFVGNKIDCIFTQYQFFEMNCICCIVTRIMLCICRRADFSMNLIPMNLLIYECLASCIEYVILNERKHLLCSVVFC